MWQRRAEAGWDLSCLATSTQPATRGQILQVHVIGRTDGRESSKRFAQAAASPRSDSLAPPVPKRRPGPQDRPTGAQLANGHEGCQTWLAGLTISLELSRR